MKNKITTLACTTLFALATPLPLIAQDSTGQQPAAPSTEQTDPIAKYTAQLAENPQYSEKATIHFLRGRAYKDKAEYDKGIDDFTEAIHINPNYGYAFTLRGDCYLAKGDYEKALSDFDQVIRLEPKNYKVMANRAIVHDQMGDYDKAIDAFTESIDTNPRFALTRIRRAWDYRLTGKFDLALADSNEAVRLDPNNAEAYNIRAETYLSMGDADKAMADFNQAISTDPKNARAYSGRGTLHMRLGAYADAKADLEQAVQLDPKSSYALNQVAWLLSVCPQAEVRDGKKAIDYAQRACDGTQWKMPSYIDTLAAAYAEAGDYDNAVKYEEQFAKWPGLDQDELDRANKIITLYKDHKPYREGQ